MLISLCTEIGQWSKGCSSADPKIISTPAARLSSLQQIYLLEFIHDNKSSQSIHKSDMLHANFYLRDRCVNECCYGFIDVTATAQTKHIKVPQKALLFPPKKPKHLDGEMRRA